MFTISRNTFSVDQRLLTEDLLIRLEGGLHFAGWSQSITLRKVYLFLFKYLHSAKLSII